MLLRMRRRWVDGEIFRLFMLGYLSFRFAIEFIKPRYTGYAGLSAIQWACALGACGCLAALWRLRTPTNPIGATYDRTLAAADAR